MPPPIVRESACRAYAAARGWSVADVLCDVDASAWDPRARRPAFADLLAKAEARICDGLLVWKFDRLVRRSSDFERLWCVAERRGVFLASVMEPIDSSTPLGLALLRILVALAGLESTTTGVRVQAHKRAAAERGEPPATKAYGLTLGWDAVVESEAAIIREAAARALAGERLAAVARDLRARGVPSPTGARRRGSRRRRRPAPRPPTNRTPEPALVPPRELAHLKSGREYLSHTHQTLAPLQAHRSAGESVLARGSAIEWSTDPSFCSVTTWSSRSRRRAMSATDHGRHAHATCGPVPSTSMADEPHPDLDFVLGTFERVRVNLEKLERAWSEMASADWERHEELIRVFLDLSAALPAVDGFTLRAVPMTKSEIEILRFEAGEVGEPEIYVSTEQAIAEPGVELREYRFRYERARRQIVRVHVEKRMDEVDRLLPEMLHSSNDDDGPSWEAWDRLAVVVAELDRLVGDAVPRRARWNDLARHLHFRAEVDLNDIVNMDWPSVRSEVEGLLFSGWEPVPVNVDDLQLLVDAQPTGPISTALRWDLLDAEAFERVVFELVRTTEGYENANWLMNTHAPDRGRDVEVERVASDALAGSLRSRVVIQCKHWRSRSVRLADIVGCLESARLWEPPPIDTLVVVSSGRFTQDAVQWVEKRRADRTVPRVDIWPENHLEMLLARRPQLIARFRLR